MDDQETNKIMFYIEEDFEVPDESPKKAKSKLFMFSVAIGLLLLLGLGFYLYSSPDTSIFNLSLLPETLRSIISPAAGEASSQFFMAFGETSTDFSFINGSFNNTFSATWSIAVADDPYSVEIRDNPVRQESAILGIGVSTGNVSLIFWNESTLYNFNTVTHNTRQGNNIITATHAYESQSGDLIIVYNNETINASNLGYSIYSGGTLTAKGNFMSAGDSIERIVLTSNPARDELMLLVKDRDDDLEGRIWNGSDWGNGITFDTALESDELGKSFESAWMRTGNQGFAIWDPEGTATDPQSRTWNSTDWEAEKQQPSETSDVEWMTIRSAFNSNRLIGCMKDSVNSIRAFEINSSFDVQNYTNIGNADTTTFENICDVAFYDTDDKFIIAYGSPGQGIFLNNTFTEAEEAVFTEKNVNSVKIGFRNGSETIVFAYGDESNDLSTYIYNTTSHTGNETIDHTTTLPRSYGFDTTLNAFVDPSTTPTIESVILNATSANNISADNLTGFVINATDPTGKNITFVYSWYKDNVLNATSILIGDPNLISYWSLNNGSLDYAGNHDGVNDTFNLRNLSGRIGAGYTFDGINGSDNLTIFDGQIGVAPYFTIGDDNNNNYSLVAWILTSGPNLTGVTWYCGNTIIELRGDGLNRDVPFHFGLNDNKLCLGRSNGGVGGEVENSTSTVNDGKWHHVVATVANDTVNFYIDGVLDIQQNFTGNGTGNVSIGSGAAASLHIGARSRNDGQLDRKHFNGTIDEVAVYNTTLSAFEVQQLYIGGVGGEFAEGGKILNSTQTAVDDNWTLGVYPVDNASIGIQINSTTLTILGTTPTIDEVILNATSPNNLTGDNLTGTIIGATDPNGDNITFVYSWYRENVLNATSVLISDPSITNYYPFNNGTADYKGTDDATLIQGGVTLTNAGRIGGAFSFDGVANSQINFSDQVIPLGAKTIAVWIKATQNGIIASTWGGSSSEYGTLFLIGNADTVIFRVDNGTAADTFNAISTTNVTDDKWHHVVGTWDGTTDANGAKMYVDGVLEDEDTAINIETTDATYNMSIGDYPGGSTAPFGGIIDELSFYNRSLTALEVRQLYLGGAFGDDGEAGKIFNSTLTAVGDNWTLGVYPVDLNDLGIQVNSTNLTILSTVPTISEIILNATSANNLSGDNLTGHIIGASDPQGDNITFVYSWYRENVLNATSVFINDDDLVIYLPFNNDTLDYGSTKDGINQGAVANASGRILGTYLFNGTTATFINSTATGFTQGTNNRTISVWIKTIAITRQRIFLYSFDGDPGNRFFLTADNTVVDPNCPASPDLGIIVALGGSTVNTCSDFVVNDGKWHHIGVVLDGVLKQTKFYIDGDLKTTDTFAGAINTEDAGGYSIGGDTTGGLPFNGSIDEFQFYNRSLTAFEINQLYLGGAFGEDGEGGKIFNSSQTAVGDNWTLGVYPAASNEIGIQVNSTNLTILSTTPNVTAVNITNETEFDISTAGGSAIRGDNITFNVTVNDPDSVATSVILDIWSGVVGSSTIIFGSLMALVDGIYTLVVPTNSTFPLTDVNFSIDVNDSGGLVDQFNGTFNLTEGVPNVTTLVPVINSIFNLTNVIEVSANVTSVTLIDTVLANITLPNGTIDQLTLSNSTNFAEKFNASYTIPNLVGLYNITFIANDSSGNVNQTETTNFTVQNPPPEISEVILNTTSANNLSTDNLTGHIIGANDGNGDNITFIYSWYRENVLNATSVLIQDANLIAYFPLNNDTLDYVGTNDAIINEPVGATIGRIGGGYNFTGGEGNSGYINISNEANFDFERTDAFSVSIWVNLVPDFTHFVIAKQEQQGNFPGWSVFSAPSRNSTVQFLLRADQPGSLRTVVYGTTNVSDGKWHHIIVTKETGVGAPSEMKIYVDGVSETLTIFDDDLGTNSILNDIEATIGSRESGDNVINGTLDEVHIFNKTLTAFEVQQLYLGSAFGEDGEGGQIFNSSQTEVGDNWTLGVYPADNNSIGTQVNSTNLTILAVVPNITAVNVTNQTGFDISTAGGTAFVGDNITFNATVNDPDSIATSVFLSIWDGVVGSSTIIFGNLMTLVSGIYTLEVPTNKTFPLDNVNFSVDANDSSGLVSQFNGTFNLTDGANPNVTTLVPVENSIFNLTNIIEISANVTDNVLVGTVLANITLPNGTIDQLTLSNSTNFAEKFNASYTIPNLVGLYNITFIANDTSNNINQSETTNFTVPNPAPEISSVTLNTTSPNNFSSDNLTGFVNGATDLNGDNITFVYSWYRENVLNATSVFISDSSIVNYYPFNNDTDDYVGTDDAELIQGGVVLTNAGRIGGAFDFDGVANSQINFSTQVIPLGAKTVSIWIKAETRGIVFDNWGGSSVAYGSIMLLGTADTLIYQIDNGTAAKHFTLVGTSNLSDDKWHHIAATWDGTTDANAASLYIDGILEDQDTPITIETNDASFNMTMGDYAGGSTSPFGGEMDEFQIYNRSLTVFEVRQLYLGGAFGDDGEGGKIFNSTQTAVGDNWTLGVYPVDFVNIGIQVNSTNLTILASGDATNPSVTVLIPINNSIFNLTNIIEISANVTDDVLVDTVLANITLPNGTINQITLSNSTNFAEKFNASFTIPTTLIGLYNITFIANDSTDNLNQTETTNFTVNDVTAPNVTVLVPPINSIFNTSNIIEISANITDNILVGTVLANITLPNGTINQITLLNSTNFAEKFNTSFTIPDLLGLYNITFIANDSTNNINQTELSNFTAINPINITDVNVTNQTGFDISTAGGTAFVGDNITFNATVNDPQSDVTSVFLSIWDGVVGSSTIIFGNLMVLVSGIYTLEVPTNKTFPLDNVNFSVDANDSDGLASQFNGTFNLTDGSNPNVTILVPIQNTIFNLTNIIEISANVTDNVLVDTVLANITLPNGTINQITLSNSTNFAEKFNASFTIPTTLVGLYNVTFIANDSSNNLNQTETTNFTVNDGRAPDVTVLIPINDSQFNVTNIIEISANVTDDILVDTVLANITLPNGTINQITLSNSTNFAEKFNASFTIPSVIGNYDVTFIANDSSGNINLTEMTNFTANDVTPPNLTNLTESPPDPANYSSGATYEFNATVLDNVAVGTVIIEFRGVNFTLSDSGGGVFNFTVLDLEVGTFNYTWFANDTSNNVNISSIQNYTVVRAASEVNLSINNSESNITIANGTSIDLNGTLIFGDPGSFIQLYSNGTLINNGTSPIGNTTAFTTPGLYNITIIYDQTQNFTQSSETFFVNVTPPGDVANPNVTVLIPINNSVFNVSNIIEISANVTNGVSVGTVFANITLPNGTINLITLLNSTGFGSKYNLSFTIPGLIGLYNITFIANDSSGNVNDTEMTNFTVNDVTPPNVTNLTETPLDPATYVQNQSYQFNTTVLDNIEIDNVTLEFNGTNFTATNITADVYSVTILDLVVGFFQYIWTAIDTSGNVNNTEVGNYTVNIATSVLNLTLNGTQGNISIQNASTIDLNATLITGDPGVVIQLFNNGTLIASGASPIGNTSTFNVVGVFNITAIYPGSQNFTVSSQTFFVTVLAPDLERNLQSWRNRLTSQDVVRVTSEGNLFLESDTEIQGCLQYNCSQVGGCVTIGVCLS